MKVTIITLVLYFAAFSALNCMAQESPALGSVKVIGQTRITGKKVVLDRKRFYLIPGDLEKNAALIERLKTTETIPRDCFYKNLNVSPQFMCWLKTEEYNCESPYCREITMDDVNYVPEFLTAYRRGMRQYGGRSEIARGWLTTNLSFDLREGYYRQQKSALSSLLNYVNPVQNIMTDTILGIAYFVDIPLKLEETDDGKRASETFLISNLQPIEIEDKSYIWVCEMDISADKQATLNLQAAEKQKKCEVITKDLPECKSKACEEIK